jgi:hypothetical protein
MLWAAIQIFILNHVNIFKYSKTSKILFILHVKIVMLQNYFQIKEARIFLPEVFSRTVNKLIHQNARRIQTQDLQEQGQRFRCK